LKGEKLKRGREAKRQKRAREAQCGLSQKTQNDPKKQKYNKAFPLKIQINMIFIVKSLYIPNFCCNFAAAKVLHTLNC
jgi:hypothetical protein